MLKAVSHTGWFHFLLLSVWIAIGTGLRFTNLAAKPPWNDEFATLVFSLGNSFQTVPLERAITLDTLLMPLQPSPNADISSVIHHLMTESTHPPVYFLLTHLWMQLFPLEGGLASFWAARSLSAIFGVASIPAVFGLGWLAFRSRLVGQIAAAMIAVSPFGIYLAQEARHYTLAILLIIASLSCLVISVRAIQRRVSLPIWVGLIWVGVNSLGIAVHYFFTLTLCAEASVLLGFWIGDFGFWINRKSNPQKFTPLPISHWWRIYAVAAGTLIGGLVWLPVWQSVPENRVTQWIYDDSILSNWWEPIGRVLAWIISMLSLLPVEGTNLPIMLASGAILVIFVFWALPIFIHGLRIQIGQSRTFVATQALSGYVLAAIALIFGITYGLSADLTIAARYQFVYFPAVIVLLGAAIAVCWDAANLAAQPELGWTTRQLSLLRSLAARGKKAVALILLMGLLGGITVVSNFGYQKPDRSDLLVPIIQDVSQVPVLIATAHKTHEQTAEMIGLGLEFKRTYRFLESISAGSAKNTPMFLLAHQEPDADTSIDVLQRALSQVPRPLDLWVVNFSRAFDASDELEAQNCFVDSQRRPKINGYKYKLYHCSLDKDNGMRGFLR